MKNKGLYKAKELNSDRWVVGYYARSVYSRRWEHNISALGFIGTHSSEIRYETLCVCLGLEDDTQWDELTDIEKTKWLLKNNDSEQRKNTPADWKGKLIFEGDEVVLTGKDSHGEWVSTGFVKFINFSWVVDCLDNYIQVNAISTKKIKAKLTGNNIHD